LGATGAGGEAFRLLELVHCHSGDDAPRLLRLPLRSSGR
jgi:hypothetical protein